MALFAYQLAWGEEGGGGVVVVRAPVHDLGTP